MIWFFNVPASIEGDKMQTSGPGSVVKEMILESAFLTCVGEIRMLLGQNHSGI
jgi:hypothetical protein